MAESLKAARERVAKEIVAQNELVRADWQGRVDQPSWLEFDRMAEQLRELQLQAMEALLVEMLRRDVYRNGWVGGQTHVLDALLDSAEQEPKP